MENPEQYEQQCMFDTCSFKDTKLYICAAFSSYIRACNIKGVELNVQQPEICLNSKCICEESMVYKFNISTCPPSCRSLNQPDATCSDLYYPIFGCICKEGTYMNASGSCVPATDCPCYHKDTIIQPHSGTFILHGASCICEFGKINCTKPGPHRKCKPPMIFYDCFKAPPGTKGSECPKRCHDVDIPCDITQCISGCICPPGMVLSGLGRCVDEATCPCLKEGVYYQQGEIIKSGCNNCTCNNGMWECEDKSTLGSCTVYGEGHHITFDKKQFTFNGNCRYTLVEDFCGSPFGTFQVITENIPCEVNGTICAKAVTILIGSCTLLLDNKRLMEQGCEADIRSTFKVHESGIYLVVEISNSVIILWDKKTRVIVKVNKELKGKLCGLCGDFNGDGNNDFTTRNMALTEDVLEFGNSWKMSPTCPDAVDSLSACANSNKRTSWAQKCSVLASKVFARCHSQVDPAPFYEACISDTCCCENGGDCQCLCTVLAAYVQACNDACVCIHWRTTEICPIYCDYYNPKGNSKWLYKACGAPCVKTCINPSGLCNSELPALEGCYANCPDNKPYLEETTKECVEQCGCYDEDGVYYSLGQEVKACDKCQKCNCTLTGIKCITDTEACPSTPLTTTTVPSTPCGFQNKCTWSQWFDLGYPTIGNEGGDFDLLSDIRAQRYKICDVPFDVQCRATRFPTIPLSDLGQEVECDKETGFTCYNKDQTPPQCYNYEIRFLCCMYVPCTTSASTSISTSTLTYTSSTTPTTSGTTLPTTSTTTTSTSPTPTTMCRCIYQGHYYLPGETVYKRTDSMGCIIFALCNSKCQIVESQGPCPTTGLPSTSKPPLCPTYSCKNSTLIVDTGKNCLPFVQSTCSKAEKVYDQYGCCFTYNCPECLDTEGNIRQPGDVWESNCFFCTCKPLNMGSVVCKQVECPLIVLPECSPDREVVMVVNPENKCCSKPQCLCKPQGCSIVELTCPPSFEVTCSQMDENQCCPVYNCTPKAVCVVDDTAYQPGGFIYVASEPCSKCHCSWDPDPETKMYFVMCEPIDCYTDCPLGYQYKVVPLKCCGTCVQVYCILQAEFNITRVIKPGDSWFPAGPGCSFYICNIIRGKPVLNLVKKPCPVVTVRTCVTDSTYYKDCCSKCDSSRCRLKTQTLTFTNYTSESAVQLPYCDLERNVGSSSTTNISTTGCKCCETLQNTTMNVKLTSKTNETMFLTYFPPEKCGCNACT